MSPQTGIALKLAIDPEARQTVFQAVETIVRRLSGSNTDVHDTFVSHLASSMEDVIGNSTAEQRQHVAEEAIRHARGAAFSASLQAQPADPNAMTGQRPPDALERDFHTGETTRSRVPPSDASTGSRELRNDPPIVDGPSNGTTGGATNAEVRADGSPMPRHNQRLETTTRRIATKPDAPGNNPGNPNCPNPPEPEWLAHLKNAGKSALFAGGTAAIFSSVANRRLLTEQGDVKQFALAVGKDTGMGAATSLVQSGLKAVGAGKFSWGAAFVTHGIVDACKLYHTGDTERFVRSIAKRGVATGAGALGGALGTIVCPGFGTVIGSAAFTYTADYLLGKFTPLNELTTMEKQQVMNEWADRFNNLFQELQLDSHVRFDTSRGYEETMAFLEENRVPVINTHPDALSRYDVWSHEDVANMRWRDDVERREAEVRAQGQTDAIAMAAVAAHESFQTATSISAPPSFTSAVPNANGVYTNVRLEETLDMNGVVSDALQINMSHFTSSPELMTPEHRQELLHRVMWLLEHLFSDTEPST